MLVSKLMQENILSQFDRFAKLLNCRFYISV